MKLEPYVERPVSFIEQARCEDWRMKVYGITVQAGTLPAALVETGKEAVLRHLPHPAINDHRYGTGFLIVHRGTLRNWFLLDWWEYEDILFHRLFSSPLIDPGSVTEETESSAMACVYELKVIHFETQAWIGTMLNGDSGSGVDEYLSHTFTEADH